MGVSKFSPVIAHGESVKVVQARLRHMIALETLDTYGHLWPDSRGQHQGRGRPRVGRAACSKRQPPPGPRARTDLR